MHWKGLIVLKVETHKVNIAKTLVSVIAVIYVIMFLVVLIFYLLIAMQFL